MRSASELAFRFRQELANLGMLTAPPSLPEHSLELSAPLALLPNPQPSVEALRGSAFARDVKRIAESLLAHRFPLLGFEITAGPVIEWSRDYLSGRAASCRYFRLVPPLDFQRVGDHKVIWELNRHQHLVTLAQAGRLTGRDEFFEEIGRQLGHWIQANPFLKGINWTSALEVALRALSWLWVFHLAAHRFEPSLKSRFLNALYRHGCYLAHNLSVYFSPNTHLLGEAVALHALGTLCPQFPGAAGWKGLGGRIAAEALRLQVRDDGSHFEQSTYYHVYALDFFLFHYLLGGALSRERLIRMAEFLAAVMGPQRSTPFLGDDDGGRVFHPFGPRDRFGRATLAACGLVFERPGWITKESDLHELAYWWIGPRLADASVPAPQAHSSVWFADAGIAAWTCGDAHVLVDAGPFGRGSAGHSHSDTLSLVVRLGQDDILIDPGTFTYVSDPMWRNWFRGSAAHNTIRVDEADQAVPAGAFGWNQPPEVSVRERRSVGDEEILEAECRFRGLTHRRRVVWKKPHRIIIDDEIAGPSGEHLVEQFWHFGSNAALLGPSSVRIGARAVLNLAPDAGIELTEGWRSAAPGAKSAAAVLRVFRRCSIPLSWRSVLELST